MRDQPLADQRRRVAAALATGQRIQSGGEGRADRSAALVIRHGRLTRSVSDSPQLLPIETSDPVPLNHFAALGTLGKIWIVFTLVTLFTPVSVKFGSVRMTPSLVASIVSIFPLLGLWLARKRTPIILPDLLVVCYCFWASLALIVNHGIAGAVEPLGVLWLQTIAPYLTGRLLVRDMSSMALFLKTMVVAVCLMLPFIVIEAITGRQPLLRILGVPGVDMGTRLGLHRAQGVFEHPILMGVVCASLVAVSYYGLRDRRFTVLRYLSAPVAVTCAFLSLSTGALLSMNVQFGLMLWNRALRSVRARWKILTALLITAYLAVDIVSTKTPFHVFINYATFSAQSSYNRILIWQFGSAEVLRHPLFGIGLGEWQHPRWMSGSMDNFWLVQAVRYGMPALTMLVASLIVLLWRIGKRQHLDERVNHMARGAIFSVVSTMTAIASVHLWNAAFIWLMLLMGAIAWLSISSGLPAIAAPARPR